jgi:hypothetical protein
MRSPRRYPIITLYSLQVKPVQSVPKPFGLKFFDQNARIHGGEWGLE